VTEVKSGPGLQKAAGSRLVAVMRRNGDLAADYARRHGVPRWYDDASDLLADPEVNAIYVATPPSTHALYTQMAAQAGKPVYVEKPMARTYRECQNMIAACREAGVPLYAAYYRRGLPRFCKIKELIDSGAIGEVRFVNVVLYQPPPAGGHDPDRLPWRVVPEIAGAGIFLDLASHTLDFLDYALGPVTEAQGSAANQAGLYDAEDVVTGTWVHASGARGTGTWCFGAFRSEDMNEVVGSAGRLCFSSFGTEPVLLETAEGVTEFAIEHPPHVQQPLIQTVVDELLGKGTCPSTGESGARTSWVMDQMVRDYRIERLGWPEGEPA